jgi:hypothetical protein
VFRFQQDGRPHLREEVDLTMVYQEIKRVVDSRAGNYRCERLNCSVVRMGME